MSARCCLVGCLYSFPLAPGLVSFRVSLQHPLVSSLVSRGNSVEISWFGPKISQSGKYRGIPGNHPATGWVFCRFPRFRLRFCPRPALRLRETRELPEWSTKHPLVSLEISGNEKCWGPSRFLFGFRKRVCRPTSPLSIISLGDVGGDGGATDRATRGAFVQHEP